MLSNQPAEPIQKDASNARAGVTGAPILDPRAPIEVASEGSGSTGDPGATDKKPPGFDGAEICL